MCTNILMSHLEETFIFSSDNMPSFYRRYVDGTFCLFERKEDADMFLKFINNLHPNIKFDMEIGSANKLEFLDVVIERKPGLSSPKTSTKIKKTDKGLFYNFSSFIPDTYKKNKVLFMYRAYRIASAMEIFHIDIEKLELRLGLNGFPKCLVKYVTSKVLTRYHLGINNETPEVPGVCRKEIILALPYLGPPSIILRRYLTKLVHKFYPAVQFKIVFRRGFRISSLFNHKDRFPMACRSMVVYYICC